MGSLERLEIYLENSIDGKFPAGEVVYGKLIVVLRRSMKIHGVEMKIRGRGHAEWREIDGIEERQLYETEEYLKQSIVVYGKEPDLEGPPHMELLDSGQHEFPFQFSLPTHIPSSFEGMHGYIRYWVKAKVYGVWGLLDQSGKVEFGVERSLDLNKIPGSKDPAEDEDTCIMCGCCLNSGAVSASIRINRRGFVQGDVIICNASIWNESDTAIRSSKLKFYRVVTYGDVPFASRTREKQTISEISRGKIKSGRECTYNDEKFEIPMSLPVTSLPGCSFIDVDYVVELKVCSPQTELNLRIPLLIIVGTIPLCDPDVQDSHKAVHQPVRDIVSNSSPIPQPVIVQPQPFTVMTSDPTASAPPMATELHELYPSTAMLAPPTFTPSIDFQPVISEKTDMSTSPTETFSILEREKTLNEVYYQRKKSNVLRNTGEVNEGANLDDEDL